MEELEIKKTTNIVSLEQAITEGTKALIPFEFEYPNTDLIVEVGLKPITLNMLPNTSRMTEEEVTSLMVEKAMFNPDGSEINNEIIQQIPIGTLKKISERITEISGFNLNELKVNELKQFP